MPVKLEEDYFSSVSEPLVSDDVWKKFNWDFPELTVLTDIWTDKRMKLEPISPPHSSCLNEFDSRSNSMSSDDMITPLSPSSLLSPLSSSGLLSPISPDCGFPMGLTSLFPPLKDLKDYCISNHDCMWTGHCASDEHPADELRSNIGSLIPQPPVVHARPVTFNNIKQEANIRSNGQQSLLKPAVRMANTMLQTPPMSDDDEDKNAKPSKLLQILNQAISANECDFDEDSDLCDYFDEDVDVLDSTDTQIKQEDIDEDDEDDDDEDDDEQVEVDVVSKKQEEEEMCIRMKFAAESDHSYHKGKNASMIMDAYGLVTPSDSEEDEEEIDVVSVNPKNAYGLPYNPSNKDCQQLQRRVVTAIRRRDMSNGIKTIMPVRKSPNNPPEFPTTKKRREPGGVKRTRQYKASYTKRRTQHSSDSEPEPSEKRSLHNNMERQRRIDLRNAFEDLRLLVPEVSKKERAAKVVILREASQYCRFLTNSHHNYLTHTEELKKKQEWLRSRVSSLRRSLANNR